VLDYRASGAERYDKQLQEILGFDTIGKSTAEKLDVIRNHREDQYEKLIDAVYLRRGWTTNGVPKISHLKNIGMDLPELIEMVTPHQED